MEKLILKIAVITTAMVLPALAFANKPPDDAQKAKIMNKTYRMQIPFIENRGQVENKDVSFYAKTFGGTLFIGKDGTLTYSLPFEDKGGVVIKEVFTNKKIKIKGLEPSTTKVNYFKGKDRNKWKSSIPSYNSISLGEVYKGINLTLKAYGNNVEKIFSVLPEGNPEVIKVKLRGAKGLKVNESGELEIITELGSVRFTKPLAYQEIDEDQGGGKEPIKVAYVIYKEDTYGFRVGSYNKKKPLLIDPLLASTFIGGDADESSSCIALDVSGNVFILGTTHSPDYPTTPGAYDESHNGHGDAVVSKLDSTLSSLLASTFIGGDGGEGSSCIAIDGSGNVYITGATASGDYPTTPGAYDVSHNTGWDVFVSKLDNSLSDLLASTLIGGSGRDGGAYIILDGDGNVYITGNADAGSSDFPTTPGVYDESHNGGRDAFISKFDSDLSTLVEFQLYSPPQFQIYSPLFLV